MNDDAKKTVLRMIPYGLYVLTADDGKGNISASTVNWVTPLRRRSWWSGSRPTRGPTRP
jgi:flavin reductase (DIM6/NTAB) family NADH-FMN oxidoreductase RutF